MIWILQNLQTIGFVLVGLFVLAIFSPAWLPLLSKGIERLWQGGSSQTVQPPTAEDVSVEDAAAFAALARLHRRFDKAGCKEGLAAVQVCMEHFWNHPGEVQS